MQGMTNLGGGMMGNFGQLGGPASTGRVEVPGTEMGYDMHRIPLVGGFFKNPADEFKKQQMQSAAQGYSMMRPEMVQAQMNAMNAQSAQLQPMNNALAAMYGTGATQGYAAQNPFGPTAFSRGAAAGTNPQMPPPSPPPVTASGSNSAPGRKL